MNSVGCTRAHVSGIFPGYSLPVFQVLEKVPKHLCETPGLVEELAQVDDGSNRDEPGHANNQDDLGGLRIRSCHSTLL